jgi:hypothetical protein
LRLPVVRGLIDRRILTNFRVDPDVLSRVLPAPFRPKTVRGWGIAGICLIRLTQIRPRFIPPRLGISSENAAHRIAVEWDDSAGIQQGVYIPRRDTSSFINSLVGGRLFPGEHHHARFQVRESATDFFVSLSDSHGARSLLVDACIGDALPTESIFGSLEEASSFFEGGALGYSETSRPGNFDGLELRTESWHVEPLDVREVESSFFANPDRFPAGSARFDCALLMRGIAHEWRSRESICCPAEADRAAA